MNDEKNKNNQSLQPSDQSEITSKQATEYMTNEVFKGIYENTTSVGSDSMSSGSATLSALKTLKSANIGTDSEDNASSEDSFYDNILDLTEKTVNLIKSDFETAFIAPRKNIKTGVIQEPFLFTHEDGQEEALEEGEESANYSFEESKVLYHSIKNNNQNDVFLIASDVVNNYTSYYNIIFQSADAGNHNSDVVDIVHSSNDFLSAKIRSLKMDYDKQVAKEEKIREFTDKVFGSIKRFINRQPE